MANLMLAVALQLAPPVAVPPPPAFPVVVWVKSDGLTAMAHIVLLNGMQRFPRSVEPSLQAKLYFASRSVAVELRRTEGDEQVPPEGYATEDYTFDIPTNVSDEAVLSLNNDENGYRFRVRRR